MKIQDLGVSFHLLCVFHFRALKELKLSIKGDKGEERQTGEQENVKIIIS